MRINRFLQTLFENGEVLVNRVLEIDDDEIKSALSILIIHEESLHLNYPLDMPEFDGETASKAIRIFYNICQFIVNRDFSVELIEEHLSFDNAFEQTSSAKVIRSVDSIFMNLPEIYKIAKQLSEGDLICEKITQLAKLFPLSSPGIELENVEDSFLLEDQVFRSLYLNRIIRNKAADRLKNPDVLAALKADMGLHLDLCSDLMEKFSQETKE